MYHLKHDICSQRGLRMGISFVFMAEMFDKAFFVAMFFAMRTSKLFAFHTSASEVINTRLGVLSLIRASLGAVVGNLPFASRTVSV
jgi:putative Ca2+/H+ antiporter (TMEM165/GDT1 family)